MSRRKKLTAFADVKPELGSDVEWPALEAFEASLTKTLREDRRFSDLATEARYAHDCLQRIAEFVLEAQGGQRVGQCGYARLRIEGGDGFDLNRLARVQLFFRRLADA